MSKVILNSKFLIIALAVSSLTVSLLIPSWHGKVLVLLALIWIFSISIKQVIHVFKSNLFFNSILILIVVYLAGLFLTTNTKSGLATIETIVPLLILPLIIFSAEQMIDTKVIRYTLISFVAGVIILNLASLAFISQNLWDSKNLQSNIILANNSIVQIHPAFVSLYLSFSIFFLIDQFFPLQTANRSKLGWVLFGLIILSAYLIWINSRTGILSFCITLLFYSFYRFNKRNRIISLSILAGFLLIIFLVPFSRERFFNTPQLAARGETSISSQDPNIFPLVARKQIFSCSIELLKGPELLYGYGTGDFRDVLQACYQERNYISLYEQGLDAHNEYFAQLHRHGIPGLVLFMALLILPFKYAIKYRSPLLAVFIILFAITALFENVFSAQKGVTFFALLCPLLMLRARRKYEEDLVTNSQV
jgi:O-antigen ligase